MKVAVVGGGSTYTPELVDGFARLGSFVDELVLVDPAAERLAVVGAFAARIFEHYGHPGVLTWTTDLDKALEGAGVVLIQLRVGGQQARISDETFPLACGCIGQETTGAGGFAKALRTVPVVLDLAEEFARRGAPGSWLVDFTNPVGIVTQALLDHGHRAIGLCNVAIGLQRSIAAHLSVDPDTVQLEHVGLNHLSWERAVHVDGVDVLPQVIDRFGDQVAEEIGLPVAIIRLLGAIPSYYLRYYYMTDQVLEEERSGGPLRAEQVIQIERELLAMYRDPTLDRKPELLERRG